MKAGQSIIYTARHIATVYTRKPTWWGGKAEELEKRDATTYRTVSGILADDGRGGLRVGGDQIVWAGGMVDPDIVSLISA